MIVILDANVILSDAQFRSARWQPIADAVSAGTLRVLVPAIAVREAKHGAVGALRRLAREAEILSKRLAGDAAASVADAVAKTHADADGYGEWLDAKLIELGFEIAATPVVDHDIVAGRAVDRVPPFNEQGGGYRDTLHWLTLIEAAVVAPTDDFVMMSNDNAFKDGKEPVLHPALVTEASAVTTGSVTLSTGLNDFAPPGRYRREVDAVPYHEALLDQVSSALDDREFARSIDPASVGYNSAEYVDFYSVEDETIVSSQAHELNTSHEVEIKFVMTANVGVYAPELEYREDGEERLRPGGGITRLRLSGTGYARLDSEAVDRIEDLTIRPAVYSPGDLLGSMTKKTLQRVARLQDIMATQLANDPALKRSIETIAKALQKSAEVSIDAATWRER
jgi:hypothetical protein